MIDQIAIAGYRSIRSIILRLGQLNIITGENGSGKSNVYRALKLIADAAADGRDLTAALQTIREIGDHDGLDQAIDDAFPGSKIRIGVSGAGLQVAFEQPGIFRELTAAELSDGTLRYLLLVAAMLTPRPPELMVLNEPENSLHPDLIPALGRLIKMAAENSQVIVVSHNPILVGELESDEMTVPIRLEKDDGAAVLRNGDLLSQYGWKWPSR